MLRRANIYVVLLTHFYPVLRVEVNSDTYNHYFHFTDVKTEA